MESTAHAVLILDSVLVTRKATASVIHVLKNMDRRSGVGRVKKAEISLAPREIDRMLQLKVGRLGPGVGIFSSIIFAYQRNAI